MWIMTNKGFISAVQHRHDPDILMVRARKREHLLQIVDDRHIFQVTPSDYPWRCNINKDLFAYKLCELTQNINYDNFKNSVDDQTYKSFLERVWFEGFGYGNLVQRRATMKPEDYLKHTKAAQYPEHQS